MADDFPAAKPSWFDCPASVAIARLQLRRSRSTSRWRPSTATSSGWWRGCLPSKASCRRQKRTIRRIAQSLVPPTRAGDFAQALMDLGATLCRPKKPTCELCPWRRSCAARRHGDPERFPNKPSRTQGQLRLGAAFVALRRDGMVLVRTRPHAGLLGGMTEVPTTEWSNGFNLRTALAQAPRLGSRRVKWRRRPGTVTHAFTHFPLSALGCRGPCGARWVLRRPCGEALPTLMRKVLAHAGIDQPPRGSARVRPHCEPTGHAMTTGSGAAGRAFERTGTKPGEATMNVERKRSGRG